MYIENRLLDFKAEQTQYIVFLKLTITIYCAIIIVNILQDNELHNFYSDQFRIEILIPDYSGFN